jgi:hypothetical protein
LLKNETWYETADFWVRVRKIPDQSGLKNVIQHTYYLKEDKNGASDKPQKQR